MNFQTSLTFEYKSWVSEGCLRKAKQILEEFDLVGGKAPK